MGEEVIKNCRCEDYPCCGHGEPDYQEPPYCDVCGVTGHTDLDCPGWDDEEEDVEELPVELRILTALVEPINDALDNLFEDELTNNILDTLKQEDQLTGDWDHDQVLVEQVHTKCMEIIGERFRKGTK